MQDSVKEGLLELELLLEDRYIPADISQKYYGRNTVGFTTSILGAVKPTKAPEISRIVQIANHYRFSLYPISTGHNWGYGGGTPPTPHCLIVDLSDMNKIIEFDKISGCVSIEPGVTQGQLHQYIKDNHLPFLVPVTGAGPSCSIIGNILDRGYGLTPTIDHFLSLMSVEAILGNGEIYHSSLHDLKGYAVNGLYKWGVGPYIDGLFAQGNVGIITKANIALAKTPNYIEGVFFYIKSDENCFNIINEIREILQQFYFMLGSVKITNQHLLLAAAEFLPQKLHSNHLLLAEPEVLKLFAQKKIPLWLGSFSIFGTKKIVKEVKKIIHKKLQKYSTKIIFANPTFFNKISLNLNKLPILRRTSYANLASKLNNFLELLTGTPNEIALPIAYIKSGNVTFGNLNPDQDGCGLIWFSPLLPINSDAIQSYFKIINSICRKYNIEPVLTITALSDHCFDSAVPLLFNRDDPNAIENAHKCYEELFLACQQKGYVPYRLPANLMHLVVKPESSYWQLVRKIKLAIDSNGIISPGRYSL